jgi:hypothetical protein
MLEILNNYDWEEVFKYASPEWVTGSSESGSSAAFDRKDVAEVVASEVGENDGDEWIMVGRLEDGRWFSIMAGCDYTGWGCQESGRSYVAATREAIEAFGLSLEERQRLGLAGART